MPLAVLKQSEPDYTWTAKSPRNFLGSAPGKPPLHAHYRSARTIHAIEIARLAETPDEGRDGYEVYEYGCKLEEAINPINE